MGLFKHLLVLDVPGEEPKGSYWRATWLDPEGNYWFLRENEAGLREVGPDGMYVPDKPSLSLEGPAPTGLTPESGGWLYYGVDPPAQAQKDERYVVAIVLPPNCVPNDFNPWPLEAKATKDQRLAVRWGFPAKSERQISVSWHPTTRKSVKRADVARINGKAKAVYGQGALYVINEPEKVSLAATQQRRGEPPHETERKWANVKALLDLLIETTKYVAAKRFAVGVVGVALAADIASLLLGANWVVPVLWMIGAMVVLFVFSLLAQTAKSKGAKRASQFLLWVIVLTLASAPALALSYIVSGYPHRVGQLLKM